MSRRRRSSYDLRPDLPYWWPYKHSGMDSKSVVLPPPLRPPTKMMGLFCMVSRSKECSPAYGP